MTTTAPSPALRLVDIQQAVTHLAKDDYDALQKWLAEYDADMWDKQIEEDYHAGRLDKAMAEAQQQYDAGLCTDLVF